MKIPKRSLLVIEDSIVSFFSYVQPIAGHFLGTCVFFSDKSDNLKILGAKFCSLILLKKDWWSSRSFLNKKPEVYFKTKWGQETPYGPGKRASPSKKATYKRL